MDNLLPYYGLIVVGRVSASEATDWLKDEVNSWERKGYRAQGGVSIAYENGFFVCAQAMVRKEESENAL